MYNENTVNNKQLQEPGGKSMKTNRMTTGLLIGALCLSMLTACGGNEKKTEASKEEGAAIHAEQSGQDDESTTAEASKEQDSAGNTYPLIIRDNEKSPKMTATFWNTQTDKSEEIEMTKIGEDETAFIYRCEADPTAYNMVRINYRDKVSYDVTFNTFVSAWNLYERELLPCTKDKDYIEKPTYETKTFQFHGFDKKVYIWTPEDYDAKADNAYTAIYMLDGQTVLDQENDPGNNKSWNVSQHVASMMDATDNKAILVCIETMGSSDGKLTRDDELLPDIGLPEGFEDLADCKFYGDEFSDFLNDTVVPYIDENYHVVKDSTHRAICGSSFGGIAAFYIGMDHPETFGTVGALSSSFNVGVEEGWAEFLSPKLTADNLPFLFFYDGSFYADNGFVSEKMFNALLEAGYPKDKMVFCKYEPGKHEVTAWSAIYPQFLEAVFTHQLSAVKSGVPVEYKDKSQKHPAQEFGDLTDDVIENDTRPDYIKNYVFFDNSETKWEKVYAYFWGGRPVNKATGESFDIRFADWPGVEMEKVEGTDLYRLPVPLNSTSIIFSTGVKDADVAKGVVAYQTEDLAFSNVAHSGKIYKIDMSEKPRQGVGKAEKTKYRYGAGEWRAYTE